MAMNCERTDLLVNVEQIVLDLIISLISHETGTFKVPRNCQGGPHPKGASGSIHASQALNNSTYYRRIQYSRRTSRHRFCMMVYLLAEIHRMHVFGGSCTVRGLYYRDTQLVLSQTYIVAAKLDVCHMLNTSPVHLGILSASKGLISGDIKLLMSNGDILDCNEYRGATSLPTDFENVERIVTSAQLVVVVEKESIFESLLSRNVFDAFGMSAILVTGKGYPDCTTRRIVHRLSIECKLPTYILVDADPFGIEIMLVYKYGSQAMSFSSDILTTPMLRWIGLHPSEMYSVSNRAMPLTHNDNKKILDILARSYISLGIRQELCTLQQMQLKAEIENINEFLSLQYIPNKIRRNLFL